MAHTEIFKTGLATLRAAEGFFKILRAMKNSNFNEELY